MFLSNKKTAVRIVLFLIIVIFAFVAAWVMFYYPNIHTLNSQQGYKGIFI